MEWFVIATALSALGGIAAVVLLVLELILRLIFGPGSFSKRHVITTGVIAAICVVTFLVTSPISKDLVEQRNILIQAEATHQGFTLSSVAPAKVTIVGQSGCEIYATYSDGVFTLLEQPDAAVLTPVIIATLCAK
jgi:hypothetical protein